MVDDICGVADIEADQRHDLHEKSHPYRRSEFELILGGGGPFTNSCNKQRQSRNTEIPTCRNAEAARKGRSNVRTSLH